MDVQKIYFMLMVQNMDRAVAFYSNVIGLDVKVHSKNWSELGNEDAVVALHGGGDGEYRLTGLGFAVNDIATACDEVTGSAGRIINPPEERAGEGITLALVADPEGNGINLTQMVM